MKTAIVILVLITCLTFGLGVLCYFIDTPNTGLWFFLAFLFLPPSATMLVYRLNIQPDRVMNFTCYSGSISLGYLAIAAYFRWNHFVGSDIFISIATSLIVILFLPFLFKFLFQKH